MIFAVDGYSFLSRIYTRVPQKKSYKDMQYTYVSRSNFTHDTERLEPQRGSSENLPKILEAEKARNQGDKISDVFRSERNISFLVMLALDLMLSETEFRQFELQASDFLMLVVH